MDQVMQSLVQSPFVRTMSSIPMKSDDLVHGVENFFPPLSRSNIVLRPTKGRISEDVYRFDIPRRDYLNKLTLVFRSRAIPTGNATIVGESIPSDRTLNSTVTSSLGRKYLLSEDVWISMLSHINLYSRNRFIETIDARAISHEDYVRNQDFSGGSYSFGFYATGKSFPGRTRALLGTDTVNDLRNAVWRMSIPLCSTSLVKNNFQTNFIESLSLEVATHFVPFFHVGPTSGYDMELIASYHQFHPNVESVIRNTNFKPGIPASLPWCEWVVIGAPVAPPTSTLIQYRLEADALMSEMLICLERIDTTGSWLTSLQNYGNYYIVMHCNNVVLTEGDALSYYYDAEYAFKEGDRRGGRLAFTSGPIPMRFGLRFGELFTGGLSLASLSNVIVSVYPSYESYRGIGSDVFEANTDIKIVVKRHYLLRIDSSTGVVSRSIDF